MQTQASVMDIGSGTLPVKGGAVKGSGDDGQFAETLRDHLQGADKTGQATHSAAASGKAHAAKHDKDDAPESQAQEKDEAAAQAVASRLKGKKPAPAREQQPPGAAEASLVPLALSPTTPPQPLHPLHLALSLQQGEAEAPPDSEAAATLMVAAVPAEAARAATTEMNSAETPAATTDTPLPKGASGTLAATPADKGGASATTLASEAGASTAVDTAPVTPPLAEGSAGKEAGSFHELLASSAAAADGQHVAPTEGSNGAAPAPAAIFSSAVTPAPTATTLAPPADLAVASPVHHAQWGSEVGERLVWMVKQEVQEAQLQLNPRHLGPIEVRISLQNEQATVQFIAHHAATREALEAALPRLRDMLQESGLQMGNASVFSQESFQQHQQQTAAGRDEGRAARMGGMAGGADNGLAPAVVESPLPPRGIDYYA